MITFVFLFFIIGFILIIFNVRNFSFVAEENLEVVQWQLRLGIVFVIISIVLYVLKVLSDNYII